MLLCRPQERYRKYRDMYSVMESRILWWMESAEDVFYPSPISDTFLWCVKKMLLLRFYSIFRLRVVCAVYRSESGDSYDERFLQCI